MKKNDKYYNHLLKQFYKWKSNTFGDSTDLTLSAMSMKNRQDLANWAYKLMCAYSKTSYFDKAFDEELKNVAHIKDFMKN